MQNPNFLTVNQYGPCKSRVLICIINMPLSIAFTVDTHLATSCSIEYTCTCRSTKVELNPLNR